MLSLRRYIFAIALLAISLASAGMAQAQSVTTAFNSLPSPGASSQGFTFGFATTGSTTMPSTITSAGFSPFAQLAANPEGSGLILRNSPLENFPSIRSNAASTAGNFIVLNPGANTSTDPTVGDMGNNVIVRYNTTGVTTFTGFFQGTVSTTPGRATTNNFFNILVNGTSVQSGTIFGGATIPFSGLVNVAAGSLVEFIVNYQPNTGNADINLQINAIPEPATMLLLGISGLGVAAAAFRRHRKSENEEAETDNICAG